MNDDEKHIELLKLFSPYSGFKVDEYYGVSMMRLKKNDKYSIQLMYDYRKLSKNGVLVDNLEQAIDVVRILDKYRMVSEGVASSDLSFMTRETTSNTGKTTDSSIPNKGLEDEKYKDSNRDLLGTTEVESREPIKEYKRSTEDAIKESEAEDDWDSIDPEIQKMIDEANSGKSVADRLKHRQRGY